MERQKVRRDKEAMKLARILLPVVLLSIALPLTLLLRAAGGNRRLGTVNNTKEQNSSRLPRLGSSKYLPEGATIRDESKDIVFVDLDGDGQKEQVIFYSLYPQSNDGIVVLKRKGEEYAKFWETSYDDSTSFYDLTGVYDLNKSGRPQIVAYRVIGASCPGILEIYEFRNGKIERITGAWVNGLCGSFEFKDLDGDGRREIIHKQDHGINPNIYRWNGKQYVKSNRLFPDYYNNDLAELVQWIHSSEGFQISARVMWCKQAVGIYLIQQRYAEAIALCEEVLGMIDDPKLTRSNSVDVEGGPPNQQEHGLAWFEIEKTEGKSTIHRLLGDTFKTAGDLERARKELEEAQSLESAAKEKRNKIRP